MGKINRATLECHISCSRPPISPKRNKLFKLESELLPNICVCAQSLTPVQLFATPWTVAHQAPLSMELSRQECCSELPFPSPGRSSRPRDQTHSALCLLHWQVGFRPLCHLGSPSHRVSSISRATRQLLNFLFNFDSLGVNQISLLYENISNPYYRKANGCLNFE